MSNVVRNRWISGKMEWMAPFGGGKKGYKMRDFPMLMEKWRESKQDPPSYPVPFLQIMVASMHSFLGRIDVSSDLGTGMLKVPYRCKWFINIPIMFVRL